MYCGRQKTTELPLTHPLRIVCDVEGQTRTSTRSTKRRKRERMAVSGNGKRRVDILHHTHTSSSQSPAIFYFNLNCRSQGFQVSPDNDARGHIHAGENRA